MNKTTMLELKEARGYAKRIYDSFSRLYSLWQDHYPKTETTSKRLQKIREDIEFLEMDILHELLEKESESKVNWRLQPEQHTEDFESIPETIIIEKDGINISKDKEYFIEWSRCDDIVKILEWVHHLSEKSWITSECIHEFITAATAHHKLDIYGNH